ncbi:MAG TPA: SIMPL domain-containing protein [Lichenihabitans sp.]|nr:SIMPL domain-containing protein [Lichenihabitans sp.]
MRRRKPALSALLSGVVLLVFAAMPAVAEEATAARPVPSIIVEGHASVPVVPDVVVVTLGVESERPRAADAAADNNRTGQALMETIKAAGIEPRDVATTSVGLEPVYDTPPKGVARLTGYRASIVLQVRVRPVDKAGPLIGALTDKGANSIESVDFVVSPDPRRDDQLRIDAIRDARHRAETYAGAIGVKLGRVLQIMPGEVPVPEPRRFDYRAKLAMAAPAPPVPLAAGEERQQAQVSVTFEIVQ